jgi:hypothetical protein
VVAGQLQVDATTVQPKVLKTKFTEMEDEIQMDLKPAYAVPTLKKLVRTMRFSRAGDGLVTIEDTVEFSRPETFEVALQTLGTFQRRGESRFVFAFEGQKLAVAVQTPDGFGLTQESISELRAPAFTRLGMKLHKPVTRATVTMTFRALD